MIIIKGRRAIKDW